jgi:hypothetical protein
MRRSVGIAAAVLFVAAASVLLVLLPAVRASLLVPALLVLPGYLVTVAVLPRHSDVTEQLILSLVVSLTITIAAGLGFALIGIPIGALAWAGLLLGVGILGVAMTLKRRERLSKPLQLRLPRARDALITLAALFLVSFAIQLASVGARESRTAGNESVPVLWLEPASATGNDVSVGIRNIGSVRGDFRLDLIADGSVLQSYRVEVEGRGEWSTTVSVRGSVARVDAYLYDYGSAQQLRHVWRVAAAG